MKTISKNDDGKSVFVLYDLGELLKIRKKNKTKWGNWNFNEATKELEYRKKYEDSENSYSVYEIDLKRINSKIEMFNWLYHMRNKLWIKPEDIYHLIDAFGDLFNMSYVDGKCTLRILNENK